MTERDTPLRHPSQGMEARDLYFGVPQRAVIKCA